MVRAASCWSVTRSNMHLVASRHGPIAARLLRQQVIDVLQAGQILLAFDHAVDLLQFGEKIAAAELDLLARAAGTKRIGVDGHESG